MARLRKRISLVALVALSGVMLLSPAVPVHSDSGEHLVPEAWTEAHPGRNTISLGVAFDEAWAAKLGPDAERTALQIVELAAENFQRAGIELRHGDAGRWTPREDAERLHDLLTTLRGTEAADGADIVLGLTAREYEGKVDGVSKRGTAEVVVRRHDDGAIRDAYVLTHEIGHILGLNHHSCEDGLCFMADHGYDPNEHWCEEHLELLTANGSYFRYAEET
jgi:hypothetical protein